MKVIYAPSYSPYARNCSARPAKRLRRNTPARANRRAAYSCPGDWERTHCRAAADCCPSYRRRAGPAACCRYVDARE